MAGETEVMAAERRQVIDRTLDEIDRALLGLLPRSERLAVMASLEERIDAQGDSVAVALETRLDSPVDAPVMSPAPHRPRGRAPRSRMAFTSGLLGIIAAACLVVSPILLILLSAFGELFGETFSIVLFAVLTMLVTFGGGLAVALGVIGLLRLARRGQSATGTGWAITGLCTGTLPMLVGFVGVVSVGAEFLPTENVEVTWSASPAGPVPYQVAAQPGYPVAPLPGLPPTPYGHSPMPPMLPPAIPPTVMPGPLPYEPMPAGPAPYSPPATTSMVAPTERPASKPMAAEPVSESKPDVQSAPPKEAPAPKAEPATQPTILPSAPDEKPESSEDDER